jgi:hypothetical protein
VCNIKKTELKDTGFENGRWRAMVENRVQFVMRFELFGFY